MLEECLASLDSGKYGLVFSSGLGATSCVMALLSNGDHIISGDDVYGGTNRLFSKVTARFGIESTFVDTTVPENVEKAIQSNTKVNIYLMLKYYSLPKSKSLPAYLLKFFNIWRRFLKLTYLLPGSLKIGY